MSSTPMPSPAVMPEGYEVERLLGQGGVGTVYLAREKATGRKVALKLLAFGDDETRRKRFEVEAIVGQKLKHPDIIEVFGCGLIGNHGWIAMEFLDGFELATAMRDPAFTIDDRIRVVMRVAIALGHAHGESIIHRDIKPSNIFLTRDGDVKLLDFGIARLEENKITRTGYIVGTPQYMSPEQVTGVKLDLRSDIFSLGVVTYQLVSGALPWDADNQSAIMVAISSKPPKPLKAAMQAAQIQMSDAELTMLHGIVHKAIATEPSRRYESAVDFARALGRFLQRDPAALAAGTATPELDVDPDELMKRRIDWALARAARVRMEDALPKAAPLAPTPSKHDVAGPSLPGIPAPVKTSGNALWVALLAGFAVAIAVLGYFVTSME
ncbi:serine/threonine protein kinase [Myxococcota bacterium]|nr:serine/threonine protein kinase [Myxococcota bacterium]